jgi:hypothetical protein
MLPGLNNSLIQLYLARRRLWHAICLYNMRMTVAPESRRQPSGRITQLADQRRNSGALATRLRESL